MDDKVDDVLGTASRDCALVTFKSSTLIWNVILALILFGPEALAATPPSQLDCESLLHVETLSTTKVAHHHNDSSDSYLNGMDKSVLQKLSFAGLMPPNGLIADMGSGSGKGTFDLASMYPQSTLVGVDMDRAFTERARNLYSLPNLSYQLGDVTERNFAAASLDGAFFSSILHHVTSFSPSQDFSLKGVHTRRTLLFKPWN